MVHLPPVTLESIHLAATLIDSANYTAVLTGAGSSTPSGIPDFRSPASGLWTRFSPMEVASLSSFRCKPERFYEWLRPLAKHLLEAQPNPSHYALSDLEKSGKINAIITQNIDGLHQKAGAVSVIEVHGSLATLSCIGCYQQLHADNFIDPFIKTGIIPTCPDCKKILKPDVILFEEQLPFQAWLKAREVVNACDLLIVAGSSLTVTPVASLPIIALQNSAKVILVNLTPTYIDEYSDVVLYGDVAEILPSIAAEIIGF
jgi:NAD-dependent deacetylase